MENAKQKIMSSMETTPYRSLRTRNLCASNSDANALAAQGYKIGHKIGEGSYATVITANFNEKDTGSGIQLACKIIDKSKAPLDFLTKFFPRELEILTKIDHANIIQTHSILQRGPKIFIFMRYAENGNMLMHIQKGGAVNEMQAKAWFSQIVKAVRYLHSKDIAHRDLKCENILLSKHLNIKLADFGFARYCFDFNGSHAKSETYCGSAAYAAPEIVYGTAYDPKKADYWSLGVILFVMLNAKMPFDDSNLVKLLEGQRNRKYSFRKKLADTISPEAKRTVDMLLEPEPSLRLNISSDIDACSWLRKKNTELMHRY